MKRNFLFAPMALALVAMTACSDDDNENLVVSPEADPSTVSFIVTSGDPSSDLSGGVYMKRFTDLSTSRSGEQVYGDETGAMKCPDTFTQVTYNSQSGVFTGYIYARGASADGIGSMKAGLRSYQNANETLTELASPILVSAFGNTGTFGTYSYAAQISKPECMVIDANGVGTNLQLALPLYAIDEVNPNISNIVDMGNNQVAMVLNYSNCDSAVVAICDYDLNIQKVIYDSRIGMSVGAQRSVRYSQSGCDDEGNIYVFCGSSATDGKVGALRINKGESSFDASYKFDILQASDGYRFRKAFHISGSKFLLEFYLTKEAYGNMDASGKMAIVDVQTQQLTWVNGLPDPSTVSIGWGDGYAGYYYLPMAAATSFSGGESENLIVPTLYKIDATTGQAEPFMTFASTDLLKAVTILK